MKPAVLYQGLFLAALALYADARKGGESSEVRAPVAPQAEAEPSGPAVPLDLAILHRELQFLPLFRAGIPGIELRAPAGRVEVLFQGDELYAAGAVELQKVWLESLEQLGELMYRDLEPTLELEIIGFDDPEGESRVGVERAEFVLDFFRNRLQEQRTRRVRVSGGGKAPRGQRLELRVVRRSL